MNEDETMEPQAAPEGATAPEPRALRVPEVAPTTGLMVGLAIVAGIVLVGLSVLLLLPAPKRAEEAPRASEADKGMTVKDLTAIIGKEVRAAIGDQGHE